MTTSQLLAATTYSDPEILPYLDPNPKPSQTQKEEIALDIYSLASLLYYLWTGQAPTVGEGTPKFNVSQAGRMPR